MANLVAYNNRQYIDEEEIEESHATDHIPAGPSHIEVYKKEERQLDDDEEMVEDQVMGTVIQGEDGEFYIVMDDDGRDEEIDFESLTNVEIQVSQDGTETLILESGMTRIGKRTQRGRAIYSSDNGTLELVQFIEDNNMDGGHGQDGGMAVGAMQTAETGDDGLLHSSLMMEPIPQGIKLRRNRVYGTCRCSECGQSFVNTARLERHLAVHQIFGSFLCPLCGKTYKYEYNLFYHWRRTCRDLNDLMALEDRKDMDVNQLRALVDEVAAKKAEYGPIEIGISRSVLFQSGPLARLEMPSNPLGRRGTSCRACGVTVHTMHLPRHMALHKGTGTVTPDERSAVGGFYCDLCGLLFRQHFNLIKHWRSNCAEIQANLPDDVELTLDDSQLKTMVMDLLKRSSTNDTVVDVEHTRIKKENPMYMGDHRPRMVGGQDAIDVVGEAGRDLREDEGDDEMRIRREMREEERNERDYDDRYGAPSGVDEQGAVFADDFEDDEMMMMGEGDGLAEGTRAKWNMNAGPIQCNECFRTFANVGRLERHMAGFHASYGSHHCALCGNRFKYDYNLLYHYRRSCPYTKTFIDRDVREQMDAASLRKLVRSLAQKEIRLQPNMKPPQRIARAIPQNNDSIIRREMMKPLLANPPMHLQQPRPGLEGKSCPVCSVIFYSAGAIEKHMACAHQMDYRVYEEENTEIRENGVYEEDESRLEKDAHTMSKMKVERRTMEEDEDDLPPTLEVQEGPEEQPQTQEIPSMMKNERVSMEETARPSNRLMETEELVVEGLDEVEMNRVQEMIASGELTVEAGDRIILMQDGGQVEYTISNAHVEEGGLEGVDDERVNHEERQVGRVERRGMEMKEDGERMEGRLRKRPREEEEMETSIWDEDILSDGNELEDDHIPTSSSRDNHSVGRPLSSSSSHQRGVPRIRR